MLMFNISVQFRQYNSGEDFWIIPRKYEMKCLWSLCILDQLLKEKQLVQKIETVSGKKCQFLGQFAKSISVKYWLWEDILIICLPFRLCTELSAGAGGPTTTVYPPNIHLSHTIGAPRCILHKYIQCIFPQLFIHLTICQLENSFYMACPELYA